MKASQIPLNSYFSRVISELGKPFLFLKKWEAVQNDRVLEKDISNFFSFPHAILIFICY